MALIDLASVKTVNHPAIDTDHQAFVGLLNQLDVASNADFPLLFKALFEHTEQHFDRENQLMKEHGFPARAEHMGEHQRVVGEFKQFQSRIDKGMVAFGRAFVKDRLPQWFQLHVTTMDSALAAHIKTGSKA
ncbi:hemerythrin family protein [Methylicorpusculum oleiharenae]|uniref:bacteriohemerythrin n=1 Tax=Methylicorpusculum oleiharenae TaxID=1338687 RepID=UPI0013586354|nr:hemerythrin family protein [Methylicorpusculum oleiharenae]MCD2452380.1 hemerythrin family protein [Methylicorpusculum oleiharenae]